MRVIPETVLDGARLGRHVEHDVRSRKFPVRTCRLSRKPKSILWARHSPILDQGQLGSCTGNAMTGWLGSAPHSVTAPEASQFTETFAVALYEAATALDNVPGAYPPDDTGSTGLAVAKAAQRGGYITSYRHAFSSVALLKALQSGPVIVGVSWHDGFDSPDAGGTVRPTGAVRGGHEFLIRGVELGSTDATTMLHADNSWGTSWGARGSFMFSLAAWSVLAGEQGDVTVPRT